ncbi:hypothetical protein M0D69_31880 [Caballeronia sp. SEWSISQ10-4 2]|uniref:hypothetical protein n=1 Tax=Caballeronia sp. SEWSISQ10-4 2 TaxID=2937438 RepID=UPI00264CD88E|nr:hypothetical protein [Caballeronia sp. SEWSISQ10-4 2]MDN7182540.1 hypothetical protein [Caballeronia sp. SEWSISQ10-4 2]
MHRLELKAELLCFLTLSEIVAFRTGGAWLRVDHLVESTRIWLRRHDHHADWRLRIKLSRMAADLACRLVKADDIAHGQRDDYGFFASDMQINFASPQVIVVYAQCVDTLMPGY